MSRTRILSAFGLGAAIALTSMGGALAQAVMKFHHDLPEDSAQHVAAVRFGELVTQRTGGKLQVKIFPNNALADDVQATQQMQFGAIEAGIIPTAKLSNFVPALQLPDLPFLFPSPEIAHRFLDSDVGDEVLGKLDRVGLKGVTFWESGFKQFTCNKPVDEPSDFKGSKVRVMESPIIIAQFRAMGATPVPIAFSETYNALQQGVVDCQENPLVSIVKMKFYEVQSDVVLSNHAYLGYAFILSKKWFESLEKATQKIVVDAARELTPFQREETAKREASYVEAIKQSKAKVNPLPDTQRGAFEQATRPVHEQFRSAIGAELLDKAYKKIKELQAAKG